MAKTKYWKDHERRIATAIGGKRISAPWRQGADVVNNWLCIECKARKKLPQWIEDALRQAEKDAKEYQLPIAVLHEKGRHQKNDLVVIRWNTFQEWFGGEVQEVSE